MKVALAYDPLHLKHDTGMHVETADRVERTYAYLKKTNTFSRLISLEPRAATLQELALVHDQEHIDYLRKIAHSGGGALDSDTVMSSGSYEAALHAAGGILRAVDSVMNEEVDHAFALVRPPGHHASQNTSMGFCLFNNVAIAAKYALAKFQLERLAILDFDVHHGNGTQAVFNYDPHVMYVSIHQSPLYPGTGSLAEIGLGAGVGTKVNIPLPSGCADEEYLTAYREITIPLVRRFKPQMILVSAGYDAHWADTIAGMHVSVGGFAKLVRIIKNLASELCRERLVMTLEGGYNLNALAASVKATCEVLLGDVNIVDPLGPTTCNSPNPDVDSVLDGVKKMHGIKEERSSL